MFSPYKTATKEAPFLQNAFPQRIEIVRSAKKRGDIDVVNYYVKIFADSANISDLHNIDLSLVVSDTENHVISANMLKTSYTKKREPDKPDTGYLTFSFEVRSSLEESTTVNVGINGGIRTIFTPYRLPLKTIKQKEAESGPRD